MAAAPTSEAACWATCHAIQDDLAGRAGVVQQADVCVIVGMADRAASAGTALAASMSLTVTSSAYMRPPSLAELLARHAPARIAAIAPAAKAVPGRWRSTAILAWQTSEQDQLILPFCVA
jgi:hypothetical protein